MKFLEADAFLPPSQSEDHHHSTASFLTGAKSTPETREQQKCTCKGSHPAFQCDAIPNTWTWSNKRSFVSIVFITTESVNVSQRAGVNIARSVTILVCFEEHTTQR